MGIYSAHACLALHPPWFLGSQRVFNYEICLMPMPVAYWPIHLKNCAILLSALFVKEIRKKIMASITFKSNPIYTTT